VVLLQSGHAPDQLVQIATTNTSVHNPKPKSFFSILVSSTSDQERTIGMHASTLNVFVHRYRTETGIGEKETGPGHGPGIRIGNVGQQQYIHWIPNAANGG
jgi:hypothetical protein